MPTSADFELPYPPSVNHYWRMWRGRMVISTEGRAYRGRVARVLRLAGAQPIDGPLAVHVEVYPPDERRRDLDNVQKALFDALQHGGAYRDDSQIVWLLVEKAATVRGGQARVRIRQRHAVELPVDPLG